MKELNKKIEKESNGRLRLIIMIVGAIVVLSFILFENHGLIKWMSVENRKKSLKEGLVAELKIRDSLTRSIDLLDKDRTEIERIAREQYGMIKPGEKVFYIEKKNK
jgi:cell division protein FtsB